MAESKRMDSGLEQGLVRIDIPHPRDDLLIQEDVLNGGTMSPDSSSPFAGVHFKGIRPEGGTRPLLPSIPAEHHHFSEPARIPKMQFGCAENEANVRVIQRRFSTGLKTKLPRHAEPERHDPFFAPSVS